MVVYDVIISLYVPHVCNHRNQIILEKMYKVVLWKNLYRLILQSLVHQDKNCLGAKYQHTFTLHIHVYI